LIDEETGNYITTDSNGNISLSANETNGAYWIVRSARQRGLDNKWFSLESKMKPGHFLRHTGHILYAHMPGTVMAEYFDGDASWKLIDRL
jgi:hypothetical protein